MSGDDKNVRGKQRRAPKKGGSTGASPVPGSSAANGAKKIKVVESGSGGASIVTKLIFWSLLTALGVALTVVYVDYHPGQLNAAYTNYIPPEVRQPLDKTAFIVKEKLSEYYEIYQNTQKEASKVARQWVKGVKLGDNDLEEILFPDEIREEKVAKAKEAAEKIKEAVEKINQKIAEGDLKPDSGKKTIDPEEVAMKMKKEFDAKRAEIEKAEAKAKVAEEARLKAAAQEAAAKEKAAKEAAAKDAAAKEAAAKEAKARKEAEAKAIKEAEAKAKAEAEAKKKAAAEAEAKAEEEARLKAEAEAKKKAEAEAKAKAEAEAKAKAEAEAQRKAEEEARLKAEAEAKKKAEAEAKARAEAEKLKAQQQAKKKAEEAAKKKAEEAIKKAEEEAWRKVEEAKKKAADEAAAKAEASKKKTSESSKSEKTTNDDDETINPADLELRSILEELETHLDTSPEQVLATYKTLDPSVALDSPRGQMIKARALDALAKKERSNSRLEEAINAYTRILTLPGPVARGLLEQAATQSVNLMLFRGWNMRAQQVQKLLIQKFPNNATLYNRLGVLHLLTGQNNDAKTAFETVLKQLPDNGFALGHLGFVQKMAGTKVNARETLESCVDLIQRGIDSGDPAIAKEGKFYFHLGDALNRLGRTEDANKVYHDGADRGVFLSFWQRSLYNSETPLKAQPVWPLAETGIQKELEHIASRWREIQKEASFIFEEGYYVGEGEALQDTGHWAQFTLWRDGRINKANCQKAPTTCDLIKGVPAISSCKRGQAKFSVMDAGTHVWAHTGPTNTRLRIHLGLKVPPKSEVKDGQVEKSELRVADRFLSWGNGEVFVFDDSFDHEVWHNSRLNHPRIILIMDMWHPELPMNQRTSLTSSSFKID